MPELPEVEFCARHLRKWGVGRRVLGVKSDDGPPLRDVSASQLVHALTGNRIESIRRHGKQLFLDWTSGHSLWSHLGMTGKWLRRMDTDAPRKHSRCTFLLDDGYALDYVDSRKFGRLQLKWIHASSQDAVMTRTGPDALHVCQHPRALAEIYSRTRQPIKVGLMDQKRVAGVGNIYAAEALHMAGIHPGAPANSLDETQWTELGRQIVRVMEDSLARETGSEIDYLSFGGQNPFMVYGRAGKPCSGCGTHIQRIVQAGRSTFLCIHCQPSS